MDEEIQKLEPKISIEEVVIILTFYGLLDLVDLIPVAGDITDVIAAPMFLYNYAKGINGSLFLVAEVLDLIPGIQEFPLRSLSWLITVYLDRHPKLEATLAPALAVANLAEGNLEGGEQLATKASGVSITEEAREHASLGVGEKSSEISAERDRVQSSKQRGAGLDEEREDRSRTEDDEAYDEMVTPTGLKDPVKELEEEFFDSRGPKIIHREQEVEEEGVTPIRRAIPPKRGSKDDYMQAA